jgi:hypothetical protein
VVMGSQLLLFLQVSGAVSAVDWSLLGAVVFQVVLLAYHLGKTENSLESIRLAQVRIQSSLDVLLHNGVSSSEKL